MERREFLRFALGAVAFSGCTPKAGVSGTVRLGYTAVQKWGLASPKRRVEPADFAPIGRFPIDVDRRSVIKTPDDPAS